jgi:hypothetical protein
MPEAQEAQKGVLILAEDRELLQPHQIKNKLIKAEDKRTVTISIMTTSMLSHTFTQHLSSSSRNIHTITTGPSSSTSSSTPLNPATNNPTEVAISNNTAVMAREAAIMTNTINPPTDLEENQTIEAEE